MQTAFEQCDVNLSQQAAPKQFAEQPCARKRFPKNDDAACRPVQAVKRARRKRQRRLYFSLKVPKYQRAKLLLRSNPGRFTDRKYPLTFVQYLYPVPDRYNGTGLTPFLTAVFPAHSSLRYVQVRYFNGLAALDKACQPSPFAVNRDQTLAQQPMYGRNRKFRAGLPQYPVEPPPLIVRPGPQTYSTHPIQHNPKSGYLSRPSGVAIHLQFIVIR